MKPSFRIEEMQAVIERYKQRAEAAEEELARLKAQGLRLPDEMPRQYKNGWPLNYSDEALGWNECLAEVTRLNATVPAEPRPSVLPSKDTIREVFMRNGFTIKEGQTDLKDYVYAAAADLLALGGQPPRFVVKLPQRLSPCASGYGYSLEANDNGDAYSCGQVVEAIRAAGGEIAE